MINELARIIAQYIYPVQIVSSIAGLPDNPVPDVDRSGPAQRLLTSDEIAWKNTSESSSRGAQARNCR